MTDDNTVPTSARTPFEQVHRGILRALYEGRFVPGQRLAAPDLMREFGVGRGTVREVLQRLASTGVVTVALNKGAQVRRLSRSEVRGILDVVEVLLGLAARGAAQAIQVSTVRMAFQKRYTAMASMVPETDFNRFLAAREDYYRFLVAASRNEELQRVFPAIQVQIMRIQFRSFDRAADSTDLSDYTELTQAVLSGNAEQAETAGRGHVRKTLDRVLALPSRAFEAER
ncbi:DNA-binding GntR family transcriptional regulator [Sphingobium xenophagum]|uniref:DNA-binding GntR family transcriptional regulator n=1 Tax=Sphingobium xenophagum TaxID=121428 RepID=A0ABU1X5K4_SPHXE|nr:GntR family transcriptional regulator [Sphingobium xenophagum]MDR7156859.1 DNA-binding GntR family transcriptional regulator [Sphingobium xenophagum]